MAIRYPEELDPVMGSYRPDPNRSGTAPLEPRFANQQLDIERTAATRAGAMQQANQNIQAGIQRRQQGATERAAAAQRPTASAGAVTAFGQMARDGESYRGTAQYPQVQKQPQGALSQNYDWGGNQTNPNRRVRQDLPPILQSQNFGELSQRIQNKFLRPESGKGYGPYGSGGGAIATATQGGGETTPTPTETGSAGGVDYSLLPEQTDPTVLEVNQGRNNGNALTRLSDGRTWTPEDVNFGRDVNTMDMAGGTAAMAEANAIRQQMIDAQPERRRGPQAPPDMASILANVDTSGLSASAGRSMRQGVIDSTLGAYESAQDRQMRERVAQQDNASQVMIQQMRNDGSMDAAMAGNAAKMEQLEFVANNMSADVITSMLNVEGIEPQLQMTLLDALMRKLDAEETEEIADAKSYAEGGLVDPVIPMGAMAGMGGEYGQAPQMPMQDEIQEYQRYAAGAQSMGIEAVPLEEFLAMREGAAAQAQQQPQMPDMMEQPQGAMAFAEGGMIPDPMDASGSMVIDPDPMAGTDSIPAMIDGQVPAKLDSGEFVIPEDVTRFFGTKKLNDMIQQARSAVQEANASPGPAM